MSATSTTPPTDKTLLERIADLEAENASLRKAQDGDDGHVSGDPRYDRLVKKYDDLSKAYRTLQEKHDRCRPYIERATEKYRAAKESAKQWQQFYDHQQKKADKLRERSANLSRASSPVLDPADPDKTPRPVPRARAPPNKASTERRDFEEVLAELAQGALEDRGNENALVDLPHQAGPSSNAPADPADARVARVTSSQTTDIGSDPPVPLNANASSDDEPEFVSARPVKRRRGNSPCRAKASTQIKQERTSPSQPLEINSDDYSSPVLSRRPPVRTQTSNLDVMTGTLDSPRRRREQRAASAEAMRPPRLPTMASSRSEGGNSNVLQDMLKEESGSTADHGSGLPPEGSDASERALQPLSANITRPAQPNRRAEVKRKRSNENSRLKAALVSEDGDMGSSQVSAQKGKATANAGDAAISRRLDNLLDEPTPGRQSMVARMAPRVNRQDRNEQLATPTVPNSKPTRRSPGNKQQAESRPLFKKPNVPQTGPFAPGASARRQRPVHNDSPPPPDPEEEPLRSRPVNRLSMDDFKINPKYKGTDFAFADTLRGRDQRRCLPGCTKPECCGDAFRKAVEMGVKGKKTDNEALEAYLGPHFATYMASKTPDERKELLIKARTYGLASEYGKHRQAFKRRTTPPGFWRSDFPTTQEEEEDRKKTHELARQEVYDRWREAMVSGGRWKFRDE